MKKRILIFIFWSVCAVAVCTQEPYFYTTLRFEDAIGNQDSVIVGFDPSASRELEPRFDEIAINTPFDSVFEVRAGAFDHLFRDKLSKTIITGAERIWGLPSIIYAGGRVFVYVWAKHQPVKVKWDRKILRTYYDVHGSIICNHYYDEFIFSYDWDWLPQNIYRCMAGFDSLVINLSEDEIIGTEVYYPVKIEKEVKGLGVKTVYGLSFVPSPLNGQCARYVGVDNYWLDQEVRIFPNPVSDAVTIELAAPLTQPATLEFYNQLGEKVLEKSLPKGQREATVPVAHLPKGLYFLALMENGRVVHMQKVVVQ